MEGVLAAVLLLLCVVGILFGMLGLGRGRPGTGLRRSRPPSAIAGLPAGIVAATAASAAANAVLPVGGAAALGVLVGIVFAVLGRVGPGLGLSIVMGLFGLLGLVPAVLALLQPTCTTAPAALRYATFGIVAACAVAGMIAGIVGGRFAVQSPLGLVAALRVIGFLASPFGVSLVTLPAPAWVIACAAAAIFGFAAGRAPDVVIGIGALAVSLSALVVTTTIGTACTGANPDDAVTILAFLVCYALVRGGLRLVTRG